MTMSLRLPRYRRRRVIGARMVPLSYVIRANRDVPAAAPALENGQPHSGEHKSVEAELVARTSHTHALYRDDNAKVYHYLEEATRSTPYAASIKPHQKGKDGRETWKALIAQYAGDDKVGSGNQETRAAFTHARLEGTKQFLFGSFCRSTPQCACDAAAVFRTRPVPDAQQAHSCGVLVGCDSMLRCWPSGSISKHPSILWTNWNAK